MKSFSAKQKTRDWINKQIPPSNRIVQRTSHTSNSKCELEPKWSECEFNDDKSSWTMRRVECSHWLLGFMVCIWSIEFIMDAFKMEMYSATHAMNWAETNNPGWIWMTESTFLKCRTEPIIYYDLCLLAGEYRNPDKRWRYCSQRGLRAWMQSNSERTPSTKW